MKTVSQIVRIHTRKLTLASFVAVLALITVNMILHYGPAFATGGGGDPTIPAPPSNELIVHVDGIGTVELSPPFVNETDPTIVYWIPGTQYFTYPTPANVTFEAKKAAGFDKWEFKEWIVTDSYGTTTQTANPFSKTISGRVTVKAVFDEPQPDTDPDEWFELSVSIDPTSAIGAGCATTPSGVVRFPKGYSASISVTTAGNWKFKEWLGTNGSEVQTSGDFYTIVMNGDKHVTAKFDNGYVLTLEKEGKGTVSANPAGPFPGSPTYGSTIVTATADIGWSFSQWKGDLTGSTNPSSSLTMDGNKKVTAVFTKSATYSLTVTTPDGCKTRVSSSTTGKGTVSNPLDPGTTVLQYTSAANVTLELMPATSPASARLRFLRWEGDVTTQEASQNPVTVYVNMNKAVKGIAGRVFELHLKTIGQGTVDITANPTDGALGSNQFAQGTQVTLTAAPTSNFLRYLGSLPRATNPVATVTMNSNKWILARFKTGSNANRYVHIDSADLERDSVQFTTWSPNAQDSGTLTLTLLGDDGYSHIVQTSQRAVGSFSCALGTGGLPVGQIRKLRAKWEVGSSSCYDDFGISAKVLGMYHNSCYNIPDENLCSGAQDQQYAYTQGTCSTIQACTWTMGFGKQTWLSELEQQGSGISSAGQVYTLEWFCENGPPSATKILRAVPAACQSCGGQSQVGDIAVNKNNNDLKCDDQVLVFGHGVHTVRDRGGKVGLTQLDHQVGVTGCDACTEIGSAMVIKFN